MKILIVEDEEPVANLLAEAVQRQGHTAVVATDASQGLASFSAERPDAVFLDIVMPRMSGVEVLRRIRGISPSVPVMVITGYATASEIEEVKRLGVIEVLEKPHILKHLDAALRSLGSA
jgi:DNA-binding response OmpR family regulator